MILHLWHIAYDLWLMKLCILKFESMLTLNDWMIISNLISNLRSARGLKKSFIFFCFCDGGKDTIAHSTDLFALVWTISYYIWFPYENSSTCSFLQSLLTILMQILCFFHMSYVITFDIWEVCTMSSCVKIMTTYSAVAWWVKNLSSMS